MIARRSRSPGGGLTAQVEERLGRVDDPIDGPPLQLVSTGSTLLDLAISGTRYPGGGIPPGILVEIFGPSGCGKTVLLCEIAGGVQRLGGEVMFRDPEARLNQRFASIFGFEVENSDYSRPDTVTELFAPIRNWRPNHTGINGIFADSLAALSTTMEMEDTDKMGMRRAKEFSEECRKTCRILAHRNFLMVCSNQVRQNVDAGPFSEKYSTPGGVSIGFYSSLRLRCHSPVKTNREIEVQGKKHKRAIGVHTTIEVYKSSIDVPFRTAPVNIIYEYGIDDIRGNLEFVKSITGGSVYMLTETDRLHTGLERSVKMISEGQAENLDLRLKQYTTQLWMELEEKFRVQRAGKRR